MQFTVSRHWHNVCFLNPLSWPQRDDSFYAKSGDYGGCGKVVHLNEAIVSLVLMLVLCRAFSCRRIGKLGLTRRILALSLVKVSMNASEFTVSSIGEKSTRKNSQQNFMRQGYMLSFEGGTWLLRETVTMLRNRDVIHKTQFHFDARYMFLCR